jgi:hypothetical protein
MLGIFKRWLAGRRAEKARIKACNKARAEAEALVEVIMAGRTPVGDDDEWFRNLEADIFHEECGDR